MSNELSVFGSVPVTEASLSVPKKRESRYLPRLEFIFSGQSGLCQKGAKYGEWALVRSKEVTPLGPSVTVIPLIRFEKGVDKSGESVEVVYEHTGAERYAEIVDAVEADGYDSDCMYGASLLVFLVETEEFVEVYFKNPSGRIFADELNAYLPISKEAAEASGDDNVQPRAPSPVTMSGKEVTAKKKTKKGVKEYTYAVPEASDGPANLGLETPPTPERIAEVCNKFIKAAEAEAVEEEDRDR